MSSGKRNCYCCYIYIYIYIYTSYIYIFFFFFFFLLLWTSHQNQLSAIQFHFNKEKAEISVAHIFKLRSSHPPRKSRRMNSTTGGKKKMYFGGEVSLKGTSLCRITEEFNNVVAHRNAFVKFSPVLSGTLICVHVFLFFNSLYLWCEAGSRTAVGSDSLCAC